MKGPVLTSAPPCSLRHGQSVSGWSTSGTRGDTSAGRRAPRSWRSPPPSTTVLPTPSVLVVPEMVWNPVCALFNFLQSSYEVFVKFLQTYCKTNCIISLDHCQYQKTFVS